MSRESNPDTHARPRRAQGAEHNEVRTPAGSGCRGRRTVALEA